jgi:1-deoxy-D-xylulose-5-phosphate synthase
MLITIEDGVISGGFGSAILEFAACHNYKNDVIVKGIPDVFIEHGDIDTLQQQLGISVSELHILIKSLKS